MGLFDRSPEIDHYELKVKSKNGGWTAPGKEFSTFETELEDIGALEHKLDEQLVEKTAEAEGWPAGEYRLLAMAKGGGVAGHEWRIEWDGPGDDDEAVQQLTPEEELREEVRAIRRRLDENVGQVSSPDEAVGYAFGEAIKNGDMSPPELIEAAKSWRGPPSDPGEWAGVLMQAQVQQGNVEAAMALLGDWLDAERGGQKSMLETVMESGADVDISTDTIKALGMLKFVDDPGSFMRDATQGMLQADAAAGQSGPVGSRLRDLLDGDEDEAGDGADDAGTAPDEAEATVEADDAGELADAEPDVQTGADLDLAPEVAERLAGDEAEQEAEEPAPAPEPDPEAPEEPAPAEADAEAATEATPDGGGVDDLDEQVDTEAGEFPSLADAGEAIKEETGGDDDADANGGDA